MRSDSTPSGLPPGPARRGLKAAVGQQLTAEDYTDEERAVGFHRIPQQRRAGEAGTRREPARRRHWFLRWIR